MLVRILRPTLLILTLTAALSVFGGGFFAQPAYAGDPIEFPADEVQADPSLSSNECVDCSLLEKYGVPLLNFLGAIVGLVVTISIVVGGIQYSSSTDDPKKLAAAKERIRNAVIALVAFLFLFALLQWLVPGGGFN